MKPQCRHSCVERECCSDVPSDRQSVWIDNKGLSLARKHVQSQRNRVSMSSFLSSELKSASGELDLVPTRPAAPRKFSPNLRKNSYISIDTQKSQRYFCTTFFSHFCGRYLFPPAFVYTRFTGLLHR